MCGVRTKTVFQVDGQSKVQVPHIARERYTLLGQVLKQQFMLLRMSLCFPISTRACLLVARSMVNYAFFIGCTEETLQLKRVLD